MHGRRMMATIDDPQPASHKQLHAGDMEVAMWGIEKDPLLRQTITAVPTRRSADQYRRP